MRIALILAGFLDLNTIEQQLQLGSVQLPFSTRRTTHHKLALLQFLRSDAVTRAIEVQNLHLILAAIDEHEELAAEWVTLESVLYQGTQAIVRFTHIRGQGTQPDTHLGFREEH
jgi:hypothetical protein